MPDAPLHTPSPERVAAAELTAFAAWAGERAGRALDDYAALWRWSTEDLPGFWSAVVARWMSVRSVILGGLIMSISGLVVTSQIHGEYGLALFVVASVLIGAGVGFAETLTNDVILATAPPERASAASAISETGYEFGGVAELQRSSFVSATFSFVYVAQYTWSVSVS